MPDSETALRLDLGNVVPRPIVDALAETTGIQIRAGGRHPMLRAGSRRWRLIVRPRPAAGVPQSSSVRILQEDARLAGPDALLLVADARLPEQLRLTLEQNGISYLDATGALHVVAPGVFVHVEPRDRRAQRGKATRTGSGLGAAGVRAVQMLLAEPGTAWEVAELAAAANVSLGHAHNVLTLLEREGFVARRDSGRAAPRVVLDAGLLLDWLATQRPARRIHEQLACALYANTFYRLCATVTQSLKDKGVPHAWTGVAAATLRDLGPTAVPRAVVRVDPERDLRDVAGLLGATPTDRGPNLLLWRDVGRVGIHDAVHRLSPEAEVPLAPPVRVYLDLLGERRGEDLAAHYRESVLGY